ncbi:hypothetical protein CSV61_06730 [Sporosarcina sp. P3]|uniref:VPA1262 family N-terminal domain-containing protein n=1 Tax=Sporosarcina sp. P3 TaxID=2048245 RepID=UPI000C167408|nr:VPA1262 family N-terminal domain-containing protein [Sporosarcina sp. P3]PID21908.1 hypothetical protein CSV61_06730 [Sporosarcina sp. P3]
MLLPELSLYDRTEITVAWIRDKVSGQNLNILTVIEICPKEQPISEAILPNNEDLIYCKRINKNMSLYIARKYDLSPIEALEFFRGNENLQTIVIEGRELKFPAIGHLELEPPKEVPLLISSNLHPDDRALSNILPKRPVDQRVSSLMDVNGSALNRIGHKNLGKITAAIKEVLFVDLIKYQEYIGSFLFSMPNPYLRNHSIRLHHEQTAVIVEFYLRHGMDLKGGEIELVDERRGGQGFVKKISIEQTVHMIPIPYSPEKLRVRIFSPEGVLISEEASHFLMNIHVNMQLAGPTRKIQVTGEDGTAKEQFEVKTFSSDNIDILQDKEQSLHQKLASAEESRMMNQLESQRKFIYFPGNNEDSKQKATEIIRELISRTRERCVICDPYLSGKDVVRFATHVRSRNADIQLLGSAKHLTEKASDGYVNGELLHSAISQLSKHDKSLRIECRVLKGRKKSPLHDRFLIIDEIVYILGSSLNEYGSKATTLFKVPDPRHIQRQVDSWLKESPSLEEWISARTKEADADE